MLTEVNEGDILAFYNAGAYCYEMSMNYNARCKPAEVLVQGEEHAVIRRREVLEDLLRNTIEIELD
jgi:diaminopimelate decarboxylase